MPVADSDKPYTAEEYAYASETIRRNTVLDCMHKGIATFSHGMQFSFSNETTMAAKVAGFQSLHINAEHSKANMETIGEVSCFAMAIGVTPIIVTPCLSREWISRALDCGAQGVIVPRISTVAQAKEVVDYTKYRPLGDRSYFCQAAMQYKVMPFQAGKQVMNERTLTCLMIETLEGLANIEEIAQVPGVDCLFVGAFDLSDEYGIPGQSGHPLIVEAFEKICAAAEKASVNGRKVFVGAGGLNLRPDLLKMYKKKHPNLLLYLATRDREILINGMTAHFKDISGE